MQLHAGCRIGIPRALWYFYHVGLWESFFDALGYETVLSPPTTQQTVAYASRISEAEHCLPMKLFDAHAADLAGKVELLFVPRVLSTLKDHISCPKLSVLPDTAALLPTAQILTLDIDARKESLEKTLRSCAHRLGAAPRVARGAVAKALADMRRAIEAQCRCDAAPQRFFILGHPYILFDAFFTGPILRKLERLDAKIELMSFGETTIPETVLAWDTCGKMLHRLAALRPANCAGVIQISSFNCGCDSMAMELARYTLKDNAIPYMILMIDEHTAQAGVDTRIEAFVDSVRW